MAAALLLFAHFDDESAHFRQNKNVCGRAVSQSFILIIEFDPALNLPFYFKTFQVSCIICPKLNHLSKSNFYAQDIEGSHTGKP